MDRPATLASIAQIRRLGFTWPPSVAVGKTVEQYAVLVDVRLDLDATIERLRRAREYAEQEQSQARAFAAKWNAPIHEVTARYDDHGEVVVAANQAIDVLEKIARKVRKAGPLPELEEDRAEAFARPAAPPVPAAPAQAAPPPAESARVEVVPASPSPRVVTEVAPDVSSGGPLLAPIEARLFQGFAHALVRSLGLAWPDEVPSMIRRHEDSSTFSTTTTWSHEDVTISIHESVEVNQGAFDSPDRSWTSSIGGLPGGCALSFSSRYGTIHSFRITGEETRRVEISHAVAKVLAEMVRAQATVSRGILAPLAWSQRAGTVDLARLAPVLHVYRWALEPLDPSGGGWFAVAPHGEIGGTTGVSLDPIGPLPQVLGITYVGATRSASSPEKSPPSVEQLGELLAGVAPPSEPEEVAEGRSSPDRGRRFRAGPWVFQDGTYTMTDQTRFTMRVQSEQGGTHAALVTGNYNPRGWGELRLEIIGDPLSRKQVIVRLSAWASAKGWSLRAHWESDPA
jgi:hypothetical protein